MMIASTFLIAATTALGNLLANPCFDQGLEGWRLNGPPGSATVTETDGRKIARLVIPATVPVGYHCLFQEIPVAPGDTLESHVQALAEDIADGVGVYTALEYFAEDGHRISFTQGSHVFEKGRWMGLSIKSVAPEGAVRARMPLTLHGHGAGYFTQASLTKSPPKPETPFDGKVSLRVTGETPCESLIGIGAEDDGWFYAPVNTEKGVDEADAKIREGRLQWMDPDWVRMFFWYKDWCPDGDWRTFDFETPNMRSHYRTLDLYQRIGARVNVVGVEWGVKETYSQPEAFVHALGELLEHLIKVKGYTCIRDWTLSNEPDGAFRCFGYTFQDFIRIHRLVREELDRRGLDIQIVGSDESVSDLWYEACVQDVTYFETVDLFASHRYLPYQDRGFIPDFFGKRLDALSGKTPRKPFVTAEFGFHDSRSGVMDNPLMETYPYAVWTADFLIEGLNRGVAGLSIWCLDETFYPGGGRMDYGLWNYKDRGWNPRPVYHAFANFTRLTEAGDTVRRVESNHPAHVKGTIVGRTLFWVNAGPVAAEVQIEGFRTRQVRIHTEDTLEGDRECGTVMEIRAGRFLAPPMSFGYAHEDAKKRGALYY
jgi:hypothetical protein